MKTIENYLDDLKEKNGSDYRTAQLLGISKEGVSKIRKRGQMSDETAIKVAELLEVDEGELLIAAAIARSDGAVLNAWKNVSKRVLINLAMLVWVTSFSLNGSDIWTNDLTNNGQTIHYAKSFEVMAILACFWLVSLFCKMESKKWQPKGKQFFTTLV